jgi:kumamolisin
MERAQMTDGFPGPAVPGSTRRALPGARRVGDADPDERVHVTVVLRRDGSEGSDGSAASGDVALVQDFAEAAGIEVTGVNHAARSVRLRGDVSAMNRAFGVRLGTFETDELAYRGREGAVHVPRELAGAVVAVLGLDSRPQAQPHFRYAPGYLPGIVEPRARVSGLLPQEVAAAYRFPTGVDGTGQTIAIIELGGGYRVDDLDTYFAAQGLATPQVEAVGVDGADNAPGDDADAEVMLDIEVAGVVAPGARIAVYFAPNTTNGFYDALAAAVHDRTRTPSIISISWGQAEPGWTASAMDAYDALFADAAAAGISVYAAAGDNGATDGWTDGSLQVDFPASSPSVLSCGGTRLSGTSEVVWNELRSQQGATGGGFSRHFPIPGYQAGLPAFGGGGARAVPSGRGVPDVAGNADPVTGYRVRVNGQDVVIGGTSAVAPLWAGLTALLNQRGGGRLGAAHAIYYSTPAGFRDIVTGSNGGYDAAAGWDPCTGLGTPHAPGFAPARVPGPRTGESQPHQEAPAPLPPLADR